MRVGMTVVSRAKSVFGAAPESGRGFIHHSCTDMADCSVEG
jgi:hypothetical protein